MLYFPEDKQLHKPAGAAGRAAAGRRCCWLRWAGSGLVACTARPRLVGSAGDDMGGMVSWLL
jgi:hypothetical protein